MPFASLSPLGTASPRRGQPSLGPTHLGAAPRLWLTPRRGSGHLRGSGRSATRGLRRAASCLSKWRSAHDGSSCLFQLPNCSSDPLEHQLNTFIPSSQAIFLTYLGCRAVGSAWGEGSLSLSDPQTQGRSRWCMDHIPGLCDPTGMVICSFSSIF